MAKPDCDDGWVQKAYELDAALEYADWTKPARIILRHVFAQIYGQAKRRVADVNQSEIARRAGMPRQHVHRGLKELTDWHCLARSSEGRYRFVKDYEQWKDSGGNMRLTPAEVADCKEAPIYAKAYLCHQSRLQSVINPDDSPQGRVINPDDAVSSIQMTPCHQSRLQSVINPDDAILLVELDCREECEIPSELTPAKSVGVRVTGEDGSIVPVIPTEAPDPAELARIGDLAERLFPMAGWDLEVGRWSSLFPLPWIARALEDVAASGKRAGWGYVLAILRRWQAEGGPEPAKASARPSANGNAHLPSRAEERREAQRRSIRAFGEKLAREERDEGV